jgi:hypothetical protein
MMATVRIESQKDADGTVQAVVVMVDGKHLALGSFGGEPEDNCESRDYDWVRPMLRQLAEALGATVECVNVKDPDDEDEDPDAV